ncbi:major facilitator superfamily domain-containing protein, partial [Phascolomyces articulosus]
GVMQNYYMEHGTFSGEKNLMIQLTCIGALYNLLIGCGIVIGTLLNLYLSYRSILVIGILLISGGLLFSSFVPMAGPLFLTFGICCGIGTGLVYTIGYRLIPEWFFKYRSTAIGMFISTIPLGGMILPLIINKLNNELGHIWTYRIHCLIVFVTGLIGYPLIKENGFSKTKNNKKQEARRRIQDTFDIRLFKNVNFTLWIILSPIYTFSMYITSSFIPSYATYLGLSDVQGALGVTVLCASGVVGCVMNGFLGDRFGDLNIFIIFMTIAALTIFLIWVFAHTQTMLLVFCALHGFVYLSYFTTSSPILIYIVGIDNYPSALNFRALGACLSIFGPFLGSYLDSLHTNMEPYFYIKIVAGSGYALCALFALIIRVRTSLNIFTKM